MLADASPVPYPDCNAMGDGAKKGGAAATASAVIDGSTDRDLASYFADMEGEAESPATQAARVIEEVICQEPKLVSPFIPRLAKLLLSPHGRVVQCAQRGLPELVRTVPAKVAKQMDTLRRTYDEAGDDGRDGIVQTYVALCTASVAYQKRVIDVLERALADADPKTLVGWTEAVLPALKGEPHAMARAVVEERLSGLPRAEAQKIADFLGIKLRVTRG
jgi:hypothetical protein